MNYKPFKFNKETQLESEGTVLVIHHNDRDGILSASCIYAYIDELRDVYKIEFISANYTKSIKEMIEEKHETLDGIVQIWIVDYSISNDDDAKYVSELSHNCDTMWIDHHIASIKYLNDDNTTEYKSILYDLNGLRIDGIAACALTYIYTKYLLFISDIEYNPNCINIFHDRLIEAVTEINVYSVYHILKQISNSFTSINPGTALKLLENLCVPDIIVYAHRYDTFDLSDNVILFSYGENNTDPKNEKITKQIKNPNDDSEITKYIVNGEVVQNYLKIKNKEDINEYGFEFIIELKDMSVRGQRNEKTYKAFGLNTTNFSSLTFGDKMDEYDICVAYNYNGEKYKYSLYTKKDDINCEELCMCMGGGGHHKAAGFTSASRLIGKDAEFEIVKLK